jgi:hypothetical protein
MPGLGTSSTCVVAAATTERLPHPDAPPPDLQLILSYPPTHPLQSEEKDLLWKYRFYLTRLPQALTKFLKAVSWNDAGEVKQAVEVLLPMWTEVGISDALEMLGPGSRDGRVRAFAVGVMGRADDEVSSEHPLLFSAVDADKPSPPATHLRSSFCTYCSLSRRSSLSRRRPTADRCDPPTRTPAQPSTRPRLLGRHMAPRRLGPLAVQCRLTTLASPTSSSSAASRTRSSATPSTGTSWSSARTKRRAVRARCLHASPSAL